VYLTPGCEINFAQVPKNFGTIPLSTFDPKLKRPYSLVYNLGVTHELLPGVAVTSEWFLAVAKNILERNNILRLGAITGPAAVSNANYRQVTVFSPIDGRAITMYDPISPSVQSAVANVDTNDPNLKNVANGFEFNFNARLPTCGRVFGGTSTDRPIANSCSAATTHTVCHGDSAADGCRVGALVIPGMNKPRLNVRLRPPGTELAPRINQVDFSGGKRFALEGLRIDPKIDLFNGLTSGDCYGLQH